MQAVKHTSSMTSQYPTMAFLHDAAGAEAAACTHAPPHCREQAQAQQHVALCLLAAAASWQNSTACHHTRSAPLRPAVRHDRHTGREQCGAVQKRLCKQENIQPDARARKSSSPLPATIQHVLVACCIAIQPKACGAAAGQIAAAAAATAAARRSVVVIHIHVCHELILKLIHIAMYASSGVVTMEAGGGSNAIHCSQSIVHGTESMLHRCKRLMFVSTTWQRI